MSCLRHTRRSREKRSTEKRAYRWRERRPPGLRKGRRVSVSKKSSCGGLFRQNTFPPRLRRGRGNVQGNLATQAFRIHRTCQRGRPPAGSGQPVPRERGMPSPNRRFGEGTGNSDFTRRAAALRTSQKDFLTAWPAGPEKGPAGFCRAGKKRNFFRARRRKKNGGHGLCPPRLVEKARLRRPFPTERVSPRAFSAAGETRRETLPRRACESTADAGAHKKASK